MRFAILCLLTLVASSPAGAEARSADAGGKTTPKDAIVTLRGIDFSGGAQHRFGSSQFGLDGGNYDLLKKQLTTQYGLPAP